MGTWSSDTESYSQLRIQDPTVATQPHR
jgi:hypothetical protein